MQPRASLLGGYRGRGTGVRLGGIYTLERISCERSSDDVLFPMTRFPAAPAGIEYPAGWMSGCRAGRMERVLERHPASSPTAEQSA